MPRYIEQPSVASGCFHGRLHVSTPGTVLTDPTPAELEVAASDDEFTGVMLGLTSVQAGDRCYTEFGVTIAGGEQFADALTAAVAAVGAGEPFTQTVEATASYDEAAAALELDTEAGRPGIVLRLVEHDPGTRISVLLDLGDTADLAALMRQALAYLRP